MQPVGSPAIQNHPNGIRVFLLYKECTDEATRCPTQTDEANPMQLQDEIKSAFWIKPKCWIPIRLKGFALSRLRQKNLALEMLNKLGSFWGQKSNNLLWLYLGLQHFKLIRIICSKIVGRSVIGDFRRL